MSGVEVQIALDFTKDAQGEWTGTFSQNGGSLPLAAIKVEDKNLKFRLDAGGDVPSFDSLRTVRPPFTAS